MRVDPNKRNVILSHQFIIGGTTSDWSAGISARSKTSMRRCTTRLIMWRWGHLHRPQNVGRRTEPCATAARRWSIPERKWMQKIRDDGRAGRKGKVAVHMRPLTPRRKVRLIRDAFDTLEQTGPEAGIQGRLLFFIDLTDEEDIPNPRRV